MKHSLILAALVAVVFTGCSTQETYQGDTSTLFTKIPSLHSGVDFANTLEHYDLEKNIAIFDYFYNGAGVAVGDINNDGLQDLFFTANMGENRLYLNKGNFQFEDITSSAGVADGRTWRTGCTMADVNADGLLDIYVCVSGNSPKLADRRNKLYLNNGDMTFREAANELGLADPAYSTHAAFYDYDNDGDLDCFVMNHHFQDVSHRRKEINASAELYVRHPYTSDHLYENRGGKFFNISEQGGIVPSSIGYGLGLGLGDLNNDGYTDVYVSNDYIDRDHLYIYMPEAKKYQEAVRLRTNHISKFSMGNDIADINNDGHMDIITVDMAPEDNLRQKVNMAAMNPSIFWQTVEEGMHYQYMFNAVQLNNGNGTFADIAQMSGLAYTDWSWAPLFADYDNDGLTDLFVSNGYRKEPLNKDLQEKFTEIAEEFAKNQDLKSLKNYVDAIPEAKLANYSFRNNGDLTFEKTAEQWGVSEESFSSGAVYADLDNDGDLDLVINNIDDKAWVYRNNSKNKNYLRIKFKGKGANTHGLGARVKITANGKQQTKDFHTVHGYQASSEPYLHFGLDDVTQVEEVQVIWPGGMMQVLENVKSNQVLALNEVDAKTKWGGYQIDPNDFLMTRIPQQGGITYVHEENEFNDYKREVLLPHMMSQWGPAMAVGDLNGDGLDDVFFGGSKDHAGQIFVQQSSGGFSKMPSPVIEQDAKYEDIGAVFFDANGDGKQDLYVVSGGNEFDTLGTDYQDRLYINEGAGLTNRTATMLPKITASGGRVAVGDYDGDGDLDLFVGGRQTPGKYPYPAQSYLLENTGKAFVDVISQKAPSLARAGMVTDAKFTDLNGDGRLDLAVVGEWMPVMTLINDGNVFRDNTLNAGLEYSTGWWFSIEAVDVDGDGDQDLVCGNNGLNYKYQASIDAPFQVFSDDFDDNGSNDIVLSYYNDGKCFPVRGRQCSSDQIPKIKEDFASYNAFATATVDDVYGKTKLDKSLNYTVYTFASSVLYNDGKGNFTIKPLPNEAQFSSVTGIVCDDFDKDGKIDIAVAGNLYLSEVETTRNDASIGRVLLGTDDGFKALHLWESGFFAAGDVRDVQAIKLGSKSGLIVSRNNADPRLFVIK